MTALQPYRTRSLTRVNRELDRIAGAADIEITTTTARAELELAKLDGIQAISTRAMQGVAMVSQLEQQLSQAVPLAASRLQAIGDMHALASADIVATASRRLG